MKDVNQSKVTMISEESMVALHSHLEKCTVACVDSLVQEVSSATLVSIGRRLFVATAAHTIPNEPNRRLWIVGSEAQRSRAPRLGFLKWGKIPTERPDVGFLELDPQAVTTMLHKQPCTLDVVVDLGWGRAKRLAFLTGAPSEWSSWSASDGNKLRLTMVPYVYAAPPVDPTEWERRFGPFGEDNAIDPRTDVLMDYVSKEPLPHPKGTSGGGIWDQGLCRGELWHPEKARLFAIQSSCCMRKKYIRGVQIIHWLRLICREYPDLREVLTEKFPDSQLECTEAT